MTPLADRESLGADRLLSTRYGRFEICKAVVRRCESGHRASREYQTGSLRVARLRSQQAWESPLVAAGRASLDSTLFNRDKCRVFPLVLVRVGERPIR